MSHNKEKKYYLAPMSPQEYKKIRARYNLTKGTSCVAESSSFGQRYFTKRQIDKFPKYLRCGGEYGDQPSFKKRRIRGMIQEIRMKQKHMCLNLTLEI